MPSVLASYAAIPSNNRLYINVAGIQSSIVDVNGENPVDWVVHFPSLSTAGTTILRDMGKTIYLPNNSSNGLPMLSTILRKVQLVPSGAAGYYGVGGTGNDENPTPTDFFTGYIRLGGTTYGGGTGIPTGVARLG